MPRPASGGGGTLAVSSSSSSLPLVPSFQVNELISIDKYLRSANLLLRQADAYRLAGDDRQLYIMLMRFASLLVETLPQHRAFDPKRPPVEFKRLQQILRDSAFPELERLKATIKLSAAVKEAAAGRRFAGGTSSEEEEGEGGQERENDDGRRGQRADAMSDVSGVDWSSAEAAALAAAAAAAAAAATTASTTTTTIGGVAAAAASAPPAAVPQLLPSFSTAGLPSASEQSRTRHSLLAQNQEEEDASAPRPASSSSPGRLYPSFPGAAAAAAATSAPLPLPPPQALDAAFSSSLALSSERPPPPPPPSAPPAPPPPPPPPPQFSLMDAPMPSPSPGIALGPQEVGVVSMPAPGSAAAAALPPTCCVPPSSSSPSASTSYPTPLPPPPPPLPPPPATATAPGAPPRAKRGLRDVHIPAALLDDFLRAASAATASNVEFCGILAGKLLGGSGGGSSGLENSDKEALLLSSSHHSSSSTFSICTLILPKQKGTSDTVAALAEEEIFEAQDSRGLFPLGWIHTHPSQSCFLSSVDVHTQSGYQTMLDEAVAVVCAPRDVGRRCGIFRLSTPGGLQLVQRCEQRGFHPHGATATGQPLYELCGHVYLNPRVGHEVVDLR